MLNGLRVVVVATGVGLLKGFSLDCAVMLPGLNVLKFGEVEVPGPNGLAVTDEGAVMLGWPNGLVVAAGAMAVGGPNGFGFAGTVLMAVCPNGLVVGAGVAV